MARRATAIVELKDAGITCSRDFRQWAREHHPDKGGSLEKFQRMSHLMNQARTALLEGALGPVDILCFT